MSLIQMSVSGGTFILFIVVVRALALYRLPKTAFLVLWEMAALRLLLPFHIPSPLSIFGPLKSVAGVGEYLAASETVLPTGPTAAGRPDAVLPGAAVGTHWVLPVIWLAGMVLMAAYFSVFYVRGIRRFKMSVPDDTPAVQEWLAVHRLRRPLEVRQSDLVASPLTYGVLRPVILLPKFLERGGEEALNYILTHELVHIQRFDAVVKLVFATALCMHWFNPFAWVMYVLANRDLELSCDERVMNVLGGREKASYALTLINMEETRSRYFSPYSHFSKLAIEERIEAIMKYKKASVFAIVLAITLVIGATTAFATSAAVGSGSNDGHEDEFWVQFGVQKTIEGDMALNSELTPISGEFPMVLVPMEEVDSNPVPVPLEEMMQENFKLDGETIVDSDLGKLVAVRPEDESKFTPEEWADILVKIEQGEIRWQDWD